MKRFREILNDDPDNYSSDDEIKESLVGKGFAISQNRQHQSYKAQVLSKLGAIQNDCHRAVQEDDERKRSDFIFKLVFDLAGALKLFAEMSSRTNNISTTSVLDQESLKKRSVVTQDRQIRSHIKSAR